MGEIAPKHQILNGAISHGAFSVKRNFAKIAWEIHKAGNLAASELDEILERKFPAGLHDKDREIIMKMADAFAEEAEASETVFFFPAFGDSEIPKAPFLIDGLLAEHQINILGAPPATFKSTFALLMCAHIASGKPFMGRKTEEGKILYLDQEAGRNHIHRVLKGIAGDFETDAREKIKQNVRVSDFSFKIGDADSPTLEYALAKIKPKLVVLDTLVRFSTHDENSSGDMAKFFCKLDSLIKQYDTTILLLHHNRKGSNNRNTGLDELRDRFRGSGDIIARPAVALYMERIGQESETILHVVKNKFQAESMPHQLQFEIAE